MQTVVVKDSKGTGADTHAITVHRAGNDTIDIVAGDQTIGTKCGAFAFTSDGGSNWNITGKV